MAARRRMVLGYSAMAVMHFRHAMLIVMLDGAAVCAMLHVPAMLAISAVLALLATNRADVVLVMAFGFGKDVGIPVRLLRLATVGVMALMVMSNFSTMLVRLRHFIVALGIVFTASHNATP